MVGYSLQAHTCGEVHATAGVFACQYIECLAKRLVKSM